MQATGKIAKIIDHKSEARPRVFKGAPSVFSPSFPGNVLLICAKPGRISRHGAGD